MPALCTSGHALPILMLTAKDEDFDQVLGLELGADDYLNKAGTAARVLLARIKALMRRASGELDHSTTGNILQFGRPKIDAVNRDVMLGDDRIELSPAEFDLLVLLASNAGKVMQRDEILKALRGLHYSNADRPSMRAFTGCGAASARRGKRTGRSRPCGRTDTCSAKEPW